MHGVSMFSLVTALVSPHAIEALRSKKETLVSTLTENANVLCFQPNDGICLLQGEWENVKKAYAILEEFYFRAQAEIMVREMLKGNVPQTAKKDFGIEWSSSLLSSLFPLVDQQGGNVVNGNEKCDLPNHEKPRLRFGGLRVATEDGTSSEMLNGKDCSGRREDGCSKSTDVDTTTLGDGQTANRSEERVDEDESDEDPPVLSKEDTDVVSLSSEMSDPKEMDFYDTSGALVECCSAGTNHNRVLNGSGKAKETPDNHENWSDGSNDDEAHGGPPQLTDNRSFEKNESVDKKDLHPIPSPISPFEPRIVTPSQTTASSQVSTPSLVVGQQLLNSATAFRAQEYLNERLSTGSNKLPQFSSLLLGGATLPQGISAWQYADLYSMHLSALQTMHIKQEPASIISSSDLAPAPAPNLSDDDFKNDLGYRFDDDAQLQEMRCTRCSKTYRSEARMKEHVRTHDKDYVPVLHSCPKCSKSFTYRHNMVVHLRRFHYGWQPAKRHMCRVCGIRFQKPYLLRLHEHKAHVMQA